MASSYGGCNMPALSRTVIAALAFLAFAPTAIQACSCVFVGNRCGAWSSQGEGVLFLGKVTAKVSQVRPDASGISDLSVGYAVHFSVEEASTVPPRPVVKLLSIRVLAVETADIHSSWGPAIWSTRAPAVTVGSAPASAQERSRRSSPAVF